MKRYPYILAPMIAFAAAFGLARAADLPKEGTYDYTFCFTRESARIDYSETQFAYSFEESGTAVAKDSGSLFDGDAVRCVAMIMSLEGKRIGDELCEGVAKNGDRRLTRYWYDSEGRYQREQVTGTGKYDGMVTTGSVEPIGTREVIKPGTEKGCNHATGTYKLK